MPCRKFLVTLICFALLLIACQPDREFATEGSFAPSAEPAADFAFEEEAGEAAFAGRADDGASVANVAAQTQEQLIIRTGDMSIVVEDTEATLAEITELAEAAGGWIVNSSVRQFSGGAKGGDITVRVPSEGFANAIEAIRGMAIEVTFESTSSDDVTDEFVDLTSRLSNLEATAARVRNFLDEARNVEEALAVNVELSQLEEQIEVIKGRMQFLSQSASFSTISVSVTPDVLSQPLEIGGWRPEGIARDAVEALVTTLEGIGTVIIWLVIWVLPVVLLFGIPIWLVVRYVRRRRRNRRAATEAEA